MVLLIKPEENIKTLDINCKWAQINSEQIKQKDMSMLHVKKGYVDECTKNVGLEDPVLGVELVGEPHHHRAERVGIPQLGHFV